MKIFMKKNIFKNIVIVLLAFIVFGFIFAKPVEAGFGTWAAGKLFDPIMDFLIGIGDVLIGFLQETVLGYGKAIIAIDRGADAGEWFWGILAGIAAIAIIVVAVVTSVPSGGLSLAAVGMALSAIIGSLGTAAIVGGAIYILGSETLPEDFYLTNIIISPQEIFTNQVAMLDVNFINPHDNSDYAIPTIVNTKNADGTIDESNEVNSIATDLREVIASWYTSLRNITLVGLMIVLLYVGIRILLSSVASEKAKYKQMVKDWVVALCILFFLHYIMAFSITIVEQITKGFASMLGTYIDPKELEGKTEDEKAAIMADKIQKSILLVQPIEDDKVYNAVKEMNSKTDDGYYEKAGILGDGNRVNWIVGNSMSQARLNYQVLENKQPAMGNMGWGIAYLGLVVFTIYFMFVYLKRVVYMAFLTMIAPLIALTYPIDKISDGQAQAFNTWLKEFLFNLLLQPMHLILYTVLIGSAMQLAASNVLYVIVAFAFMMPAEKLMRRFFGFEKASTAGALGGAAGAALLMSGMRKLSGKDKKDDSNKSDGKTESNDKDIRQKDDFNEFDALSEGESPDSGGNPPPRIAGDTQNSQGDNEADNQNNSGDSENPGGSGDQGGPGDNNIPSRNGLNAPQNSNGGYFPPLRPKREGKFRKGLGRAIRYRRAENQKRYISKGGFKGMMMRGLKSGAQKSLGLMAGATAATALGIASLTTGDPSKMISNMAAGASVGYGVGKKALGNLGNGDGMTKSIEEFKKGYYGDEEYKIRRDEKRLKELKRNVEFTNKLYDEYDKETVKDMLRDHGKVDQLYGYGIEDQDDLVAALGLINSGAVKDSKQAAATTKMAKRVGDYDSYKQKDREDWEKTLRKEFAERVGDSKADKLTTDTIARIRQFNNIRYKKQ